MASRSRASAMASRYSGAPGGAGMPAPRPAWALPGSRLAGRVAPVEFRRGSNVAVALPGARCGPAGGATGSTGPTIRTPRGWAGAAADAGGNPHCGRRRPVRWRRAGRRQRADRRRAGGRRVGRETLGDGVDGVEAGQEQGQRIGLLGRGPRPSCGRAGRGAEGSSHGAAPAPGNATPAGGVGGWGGRWRPRTAGAPVAVGSAPSPGRAPRRPPRNRAAVAAATVPGRVPRQ